MLPDLTDRDRQLIAALQATADDKNSGLANAVYNLIRATKPPMTRPESRRLLQLVARALTFLVELHDVPTGEDIHA